VKRRIWLAIASGVLCSSFAVAQTDSHFDFSGNMSFNGATLSPAPSSGAQVNAFGWQTSGITHLNRWLGVTSQFGAGYASSNAITLIGYTGPGSMRHYSMLLGPRIILPTRTRFSPFIEGLVGADRASTNLVSNGTPVTGRELQTAYAFGGGAQIAMSRHFGLNFEGQYFGTEHTLAFTGWEPAHFQISAGIVIRMFGRDRQIAEERPLPPPSEPAIIQPTPQPTIASVEVSAPASSLASVQPAAPVIVTPSVVAQPIAAVAQISHAQKQQPIVVVQPTIQPTLARVEVSGPASSFATVQPAAPVLVTPHVVAQPLAAIAENSNAQKRPPTVSVQTVAPVVSAPKIEPVMNAKVIAPAVPIAQTQPAPQQLAAVPRPAVMAQTQPVQRPQSAPMSLGEYARRLREKKQREQRQ
jgi:outer membrane protein with beta-barrel domain